jgi:hypothetical protein
MRRLLSLTLLCLTLLAARTADGATLASRFPTLVGTLQARIAAFGSTGLSKVEKKQKSTLTKSVNALSVDTEDLAATLVNAGKAVKGVDAVYPADGTLSPLLDDLLADVTADVTRRGAVLFFSIQALADGSSKTKAQALSDGGEASIVASATATPRSARIALLKRALKSIAKGEKVVRKAGGGGGVTTTALDVDIDGQHLHLPPASADTFYSVTFDTAMNRFLLSGRGKVGADVHAFTMMVPNPDFGARVVPPGPQSGYTPPVPGGGPYLLTSGTVTFTTWDPTNARVAARFTLTFANSLNTVQFTDGTLSSTSLIVQ